MDNLPNELLVKIIYLLPIKEIIKNKIVNKKWHSIIESIVKVKSLMLCNYLPDRGNLFRYDRIMACCAPVDCENVIRVGNQELSFTVTRLNQPIFINLRSLFLVGIHPKANGFLIINFLNNFKQLEHLRLAGLRVQCKGECCNLELPNLKILNIIHLDIKKRIVFNTPSLRKVIFGLNKWQNNKISFKYVRRIKTLEMVNYNKYAEVFANLEYFYCSCLEYVDLSNWPYLKEIQFSGDEEVWKDLKKQKDELRRDYLKIYYLGFEFDKMPNDKMQSILWDITNARSFMTVQSYSINYNILANVLPYVTRLCYLELECHSDHLPGISDLMRKFVNLHRLTVLGKIYNLDQFIVVLENCPSLASLELISSSLNQQFFDNLLLKLCPNLDALKIERERDLNFTFLNKFKKIHRFSTDQKLCLEWFYEIIKSRDWREFTFNHNGTKIEVCCFKSFTIKGNYGIIRYSENSLDKLISRLKSL